MSRGICIVAVLLVTACTSSTHFGECIGVFDDPLPDRIYKVSGWNVAMAIIFSEMIFPPVIVIASEIRCPVGIKPELKKEADK